MRLLLLSVLALWVAIGSPLHADDAPPQVTAAFATRDAWVGQKVTLAIELLAPGYFSGVPHFDYPQVSGLLIVPPEEHPVVGSRLIDGQSYTVQRYEISLFARRAGPFKVPSFEIRFGLKRSPLDHDATPQEVTTPTVSFTAKLPPGAEKLTSLISARDLVMAEKWTPQPHDCKVGDAFTRTITFTATDVPGMAFPPFPLPKIEGLAIYAKPPVVADASDRGELQGKRTETLIYLCQRPGHFTVPAAQLTWWNTGTQALETIRLPTQKWDVAPDPAEATSPEPPVAGTHWTEIITLGGIAMAILGTGLIWNVHRGTFAFLRSTRLEPLNLP